VLSAMLVLAGSVAAAAVQAVFLQPWRQAVTDPFDTRVFCRDIWPVDWQLHRSALEMQENSLLFQTDACYVADISSLTN
jgi:hypothetical protein